MSDMDKVYDMIATYRAIEKFSKTLVNFFNNHTGLYDGDPLFETATSPLCKHWRPAEEEPELFMNWQCAHPKAEGTLMSDRDSCCVMGCPDEKYEEEPGGIICAMHSNLMNLESILVGDIFNTTGHNLCDYHMHPPNMTLDRSFRPCRHEDSKWGSCCVANCPLGEKEGEDV